MKTMMKAAMKTPTSCDWCCGVAIPGAEICPECLLEDVENQNLSLEILDPYPLNESAD
mgnify:CR=1 FL=1